MMKIWYENSFGDILDLLKPPYMLQTADFFDYRWEVLRKGGKISGFKKDIVQHSALLSILNYSKESYYESVNRFAEVTEKDILAKRYGKLHIGDMYLQCFITESKKSEWENDIELMDVDITVCTDRPFWVYEKEIQLLAGSRSKSTSQGLDFPFDFPFDFAAKKIGSESLFIKHYSSSDFLMRIHGAVQNPEVRINDYSYKINTTLKEQEYLEINSKANSVIKYGTTGIPENLYNSRDFANSVFKKIPSGSLDIKWDGTFGVDIILYLERSEPLWSYNMQM